MPSYFNARDVLRQVFARNKIPAPQVLALTPVSVAFPESPKLNLETQIHD